MTGIEQALAISGIIFFAGTVKATFGFGEALIAMPLLAWFLPIEETAPTVALVSIVTGSSVLIREWKHVDFRGALHMIIPAAISIPLGVWFLRTIDDRLVKSLLAIMILGFAVWSLKREHKQALSHDRWAPLAGFLAGLLGGAYNTAGPPVVIYGSLRHWSPEKFRGQLQSFFSFSTFWVVMMHFSQGLVTENVLKSFLSAIPGLLLGLIAGHVISKKIPVQRFREVIYYLLIVIGVMLLWNVFRG
ncbi:MAG: sulfite exporter TauE/SafE family protein [Planctomycetaceae bacterium]|nr:sulfite exporter TauE/SafE family protein [Planctomycetaceae bacterium]MDG2391824.1 sulfite exporter TauE/SafE family protein [Planctomycetaceae bacterium]